MSQTPTVLRGMTWNHTRGYLPLVATAQRFSELNPAIEVVWEKRSLKAFEEFPVERLAADYDLIVIDHPFSGYAAKHGPLLPLDEHLPASFLADQAGNSVGASYVSYLFGGHQWALPIDAATPVSFWREDLIASLGLSIPRTWDDLLALAGAGHVEIPAAPINCLMDFYTLCLALGEIPFKTRSQVVSVEAGCAALAFLRELIGLCDSGCWGRNPIASHELVASASNKKIAYAVFAYGYSNYARPGYVAYPLTFGDVPSFKGAPLRTVLGGTGMAVSALRPHRREALAYTEFVASSEIQRTLYTQMGGQPGHRSAWLEAENNHATGNYFAQTFPTLTRAWIRPRYCGYLEFQERGGLLIHEALRGTLTDSDALAQLDSLYRDTLHHALTLV